LCDDWTAKILRELETERNTFVQSSRPEQQNLENKIRLLDERINRLIDIYMEGAISLEEYRHKKEELLNKKKELQETVKDFAVRDNNWFEPAKEFVTLLNRLGYEAREGNLESQKEFLQKIGSNFILKERRLIFSSEGTLRHYIDSAPHVNWRRGRDLVTSAPEGPA
jgi:hypothetical protein